MNNSFFYLVNSDLLFAVADVVEKTALGCHDYIGMGNSVAADAAAVDAMRASLNGLPVKGKIVIGEGERDDAPMLYIGEKVGCGEEEVDIAVDPLEGTNICANGANGALSVLALGPKDSILHAPDLYMKKIAISARFPENLVNINDSISNNIINIARHKGCRPSDIKMSILNRDRHSAIIEEARSLGVKIFLIDDGDISAVIMAADDRCDIDLYVGTGGAPEGVLAAAALKCMRGHIQCKLLFDSDQEVNRSAEMGINDLYKIYKVDDLVRDDVIFAACGITDGEWLRGVKVKHDHYCVNSLVMHFSTKKLVNMSSYRWK